MFYIKGWCEQCNDLFDSLPFEANQFCVISGRKDHNNSGDDHGDWEYRTTGSVITGGVNNSFSPPLPSSGNSPQMTISGGYHNRVYGRMGVTNYG